MARLRWVQWMVLQPKEFKQFITFYKDIVNIVFEFVLLPPSGQQDQLMQL